MQVVQLLKPSLKPTFEHTVIITFIDKIQTFNETPTLYRIYARLKE